MLLRYSRWQLALPRSRSDENAVLWRIRIL